MGRGCTIGHGAIVHGCTVGDNTLIGMGAIVLNGAKIGSDCIVGAGALVTGKMDAPDGSMILGSPAKVVRPLKPEEIEGNRAAVSYTHLDVYKRQGGIHFRRAFESPKGGGRLRLPEPKEKGLPDRKPFLFGARGGT